MTYQAALHALADPTRREILERLREGPLPVGRVAEGLPVSRPAVSQHLRVLEDAGLVEGRREGTRRVYGVSPRGLVELRRYLDRFWGDVLQAFKAEAERAPTEKSPRPRPPRPARTRRRGRKGTKNDR